MFEPRHWTHDELVREALQLCAEADPRAIANAFFASLGTRRLDHRSALGSYAVLKNFPAHSWTSDRAYCATCGSYGTPSSEVEDLNVLNFERHKWGGVRHSQPLYAILDLQQFEQMERIVPEPDQISLLSELLLAFDAVPNETTAAHLEKVVPKSMRSNKAERDVLVEILRIASIQETSEHAGFLNEFIDADRRELPDRRFVDMAYPACWWVGANGVNWGAAEFWFGHLSPTIRSTRSRVKRAPG